MNQQKPNLIYIIIDQFRNDWREKFPFFQNLKEDSVLFSEMITYAPYTLASIHAMLSGIYGNRNGVNAYYTALQFKKDQCKTLTSYLKENGYLTYGDTFNKLFVPSQDFDTLDYYDEYQLGNQGILDRHQKILQELSRNKKPFFAFLHHSYIHAQIVQNVIRKYETFDPEYFNHLPENSKRYQLYASSAVEYLEKIFATIKTLGLNQNSLIILCTDHGGGIGEKPGEKAYGIFTYDYTIKIWCYLIHSFLLPKNQELLNQVRSIDIMPTILNLFQIQSDPKFLSLDGQSLLSIIHGKEIGDRAAFCETSPLEGPNPSPEKPSIKCIRTKEYKLIFDLINNKKELYNLKSDPEERHNLIEQKLAIKNQLWQILKQYL